MDWKKIATRSLLAMMTGLFCSAAFAGACDTDSCTSTVKMLYVTASGSVYVQLNVSSSDTSTLNCSLTSGVYFTITPSSTTNFNSMYATLLAAAHAGHVVDVRAADNSSGCSVLYVWESF